MGSSRLRSLRALPAWVRACVGLLIVLVLVGAVAVADDGAAFAAGVVVETGETQAQVASDGESGDDVVATPVSSARSGNGAGLPLADHASQVAAEGAAAPEPRPPRR